MNSLSAEPRTIVGKSSAKLAKDGRLPAVVYGPKQEPMSVSLARLELEAFLRHGGESTVIDLTGLGKPIQALIHHIDRDPVTSVPRHVDLYAVEKGAKVTVTIPLSFVGESEAVRLGANLVKVLHEIEVESAPANLPTEIEVDITALAAIDDRITVADLTVPAGVEILVDGEEVVAIAQAIQEEVEEESAAPDMDAIEVEKKGKDEQEEEAA